MDIKEFLDISAIIAEGKQLLQGLYDENKPVIKETVDTYLKALEQRTTLLAQNRLSNEITDEFMLDRLKDEKDIFISELLSFTVIGKAIAQQAANSLENLLIQKALEALNKLQNK